jgi:hypothetical protein
MKKVKVSICMMIIFSLLVLSSCGNKESDKDSSHDSAIETTTIEAENIAVEEQPDEYASYLKKGDIFQFDQGTSMTILDIGTYSDYYSDGMNFTYVYVECEFQNNSNESVKFYSDEMLFYADDELMDTGYPATTTDYFEPTSLASGRKIKGRFYAEIPNYESRNIIEGVLGDAKVLVKNKNQQNPVDVVDDTEEQDMVGYEYLEDIKYGDYINRYADGESAFAEIIIEKDTISDYLMLTVYNNDGEEIGYFGGIAKKENDGYFAESEDDHIKLKIFPDEDGVVISFVDDVSKELKQAEGYYTLYTEYENGYAEDYN